MQYQEEADSFFNIVDRGNKKKKKKSWAGGLKLSFLFQEFIILGKHINRLNLLLFNI